ncbi:deleted in azoospermia-like isoform X2 [Gouania willdenowi]|uniref:deleted in azoospermia-like isoform X2 n=1 Tax=Gouania willdenowi TaxID=441366 RepID=UPI001054F28F|nr:deleted in azoospermia-like isoform X2 [Gouania willdenowi]
MDFNKPRATNQYSPSLKLSNGFVLPEGKLTPNALFVGGIDFKVNESEIRDYFGRYGSVKEVKIITYRGGIRKGYGFVYFNEDVNIQSIIEQQVSFRGRKLKLGPAILRERVSRSMPSYQIGPHPWVNPAQYIYCRCSCCPPVGGGVTQPSPVLNGGSTYSQPYVYNNFEGVLIPQTPIIYPQNPFAYQAVHTNSLDGRPEDSAYQSELCGLWSPDYADCAVMYSY